MLSAQDHKYQKRIKTLEDARYDIEQDWLDIQKFVLPRKGMFWRRGQKIRYKRDHSNIIDPEATLNLKDLAAALLSGYTPKTRPWLRMTLQDTDLMEYPPVKEWFHNVTKTMLDIYSWTNTYSSLHTVYKELIGFGTGAMLEEFDIESLVRFNTFTTGEYYIAVNEKGEVDVFYRTYEMTAENIVNKFGIDKVSDSIRQAYEKPDGKDKYFPICHAIQPNHDANPDMIDNQNMMFESVYWEKREGKKLLSKSGYEELPIFVPRWDVTSTESPYGESPTKDLLGHIKMLQEMNIGQVKAMHKENDPPMRVPSKFKGRLSLIPGAQNVDPEPGGKGISRLYDMNFDWSGVTEKIHDVREQIRRGYFIDLLKMLAARPGLQPPTATEVAERHEEKVILLSPILERSDTGLLNPMNKRTFNMGIRYGLFPEPPQEIQGQRMKVEYTSLLAQTQKMIGLQPIETFLGFISQAGTLKEDMLDKVDFDQMVDEYADATGLPPKIVLSDETVKAIRDARAKQAQERQEMEMALSAAQGIKDVGGLSTEKGTALGDLVSE